MKTFLRRIQIPMSTILTGLLGDLAFGYAASNHINSLSKDAQNIVYFLLIFGGLMVVVGILWIIAIAKVSFGKDAIEYSSDEEIQ